MKRALALLLLVPSLAHAAPTVHERVAALSKRYLDGLFASRPHLATFMGDHRFDDRIADLDEGVLGRRREEVRAVLQQADALRPTTTDDKVDVAVLRDGAHLELLYLEEIRDFAWDPRLHDSFPYYDPREVVAGRLSDVVHGDYAPEAERRRAVVAQLGVLPRYLDQVKGWLMRPYRGAVPAGWRKPPRVYVEQALKDNTGRIDFVKTEVAAFVKADPSAQPALAAALDALERYQAFLGKELLPRADGDWRLGKALYDKKFGWALQTVRTPDEMVAQARAEFARSKAALAEVAKQLHGELFPGQPAPTEPAALIGKVKDKLALDHARPEELVAAHGRRLDALRAFIEQKKLVELPPRDTLSVAPMPEFKRGSSAAEYLAPGVLDKREHFHATYYVDPIDPSWSKEKVESYLRGQNDYEVELVAAHEAYPGHHTQFAQSRKDESPLRATLWNGPMVEGWAVYGEGKLVAAGWGGSKNARYRFFDLRGRMISASNLILDVLLQRGEMSDEDAVRFMVVEGFQEKAMAEKKLLRAKLDSTQLCQYYLGLAELDQLEADARRQQPKKDATAFQHDFDMAVIGHGAIAVKLLRDYVLAPAP